MGIIIIISISQIGAYPCPEHYHKMRRPRTDRLIRLLHSIVHSTLFSADMDSHLRTAKVDVDSRTEAFWFKSGFPPDRKVVFKRLQKQEKIRKKKFFLKNNADFTDEEVYKGGDVPIQILTKGSFKIRNRGMIRPFASKEEQVCRMAMEIPIYEYNRKSTCYQILILTNQIIYGMGKLA